MAHRKSATAEQITLHGIEYVVIPRIEYLRLCGSKLPPGTVDAREYVQDSIANALLAARKHAKLSQIELAERLGKSQSLVQRAESGSMRVSSRYMEAVLKACGLPADWVPPKPKRSKRVPNG